MRPQACTPPKHLRPCRRPPPSSSASAPVVVRLRPRRCPPPTLSVSASARLTSDSPLSHWPPGSTLSFDPMHPHFPRLCTIAATHKACSQRSLGIPGPAPCTAQAGRLGTWFACAGLP
eukprot:362860-Chlamydomonas_euryale.AAC.14